MSDHPKVPQALSHPVNDNLRKLAELFPSAVKDGELDLEALREELGEYRELQPGDERYELSWAGKQAAKKKAFEPLLGRTIKLDPEQSKDPDTTGNLFIEGDNLEALKLLRQNYYGEVKMIYIDPPYNTGNDFVYKDKFSTSRLESDQAEGAVSEEGERLFKNEESSNRFHANWLNMMYPRLRLAKDLLREDGVIFISISDNEIYNLMSLCNEVFGFENLLGSFIWRKKEGGGMADENFVTEHEYMICYQKSLEFNWRDHQVEEGCEEFNYEDSKGKYKLVKLAKWGNTARREDRPSMYYSIQDNEGMEYYPVAPDGGDGRWRVGLTKMRELLDAGLVEFKKSKESKIPYEKIYYVDRNLKTIKTRSILYEVGGTSTGTNQLTDLFEIKDIFNNPKPTNLLNSFLKSNLLGEEIILDFFAGSCTTAHAVMELNAEDGGNREHIMVQLPEPCDENSAACKAGYKNIAEIGRERIRRAGEKIKEDLRKKSEDAQEQDQLGLTKEEGGNPYKEDPDKLDVGFKCFQITDTNINWLKQDLMQGELTDLDVSDMDKLDFVPGFTDIDVVYEIMLRQASIPLTESITRLTHCGERTYLYGASYLICLKETVTKEMVEQLAKLEPTPLKFFFRDSAFGKDIAFKDETFRRLSAEVAKHAGEQETYTVEFI